MKNDMLTAKHLQSFRDYLFQEEKSAATIEKYCRDVNRFLFFVGEHVLTKELVISYKKYLAEQNYAVRSINSMLASLNCFLEFLGRVDLKVKIIRIQRKAYCEEKQELTKAEYLRLLDAAKNHRQLKLVMQTICSTGIRISELKYFSVEGVLRGEISVHCKNKTRIILIPGKLKKLLLAYAKQRSIKSGPIFITRSGKPLDRSNIWSQMKKLCDAAGVARTKVFPHNLRKLFARTFYRIEKDIAKLADILGHGSIETTRIYIMTTGVEHRRKIEQLGLVI